MENASKALLMAGGVLIGVLIMSLAVYLFADFGSKSASINEQNSQKQLAAFNSKFTSYQNFKDETVKNGIVVPDKDKWKITIYDIITVKGYADENNEKNESEEEKITVTIANSPITKTDTELIKDYGYKNGELTKFKCLNKDIQYNNRGKVKSINFSEAD